jgi:hypothetical protein
MWQHLDVEEPVHFTYTPCIDIVDAFVPTEQEANPTVNVEVS